MWFMWMMWAITGIAVAATVILLTGKGSMLVSGFNTKSPRERAAYDRKLVSPRAGRWMALLDIGLVALTAYIQFRAVPAIENHTIEALGTEITVVALALCAYMVIIGIIAASRGFKGSKKQS